MKTQSKRLFIAKAIFFGISAAAAVTLIVMLLWNWLMPEFFGLKTITYWQSLGILILAKILFGSGHHEPQHFHKFNRENFRKNMFFHRIEEIKKKHQETDI